MRFFEQGKENAEKKKMKAYVLYKSSTNDEFDPTKILQGTVRRIKSGVYSIVRIDVI